LGPATPAALDPEEGDSPGCTWEGLRSRPRRRWSGSCSQSARRGSGTEKVSPLAPAQHQGVHLCALTSAPRRDALAPALQRVSVSSRSHDLLAQEGPKVPRFPALAKKRHPLLHVGRGSRTSTHLRSQARALDNASPEKPMARAGAADRSSTTQNGFGSRPSYWKYQNRGKSGLPVSELFPRDRPPVPTISLCVVRSMTSEVQRTRPRATCFMHTGFSLHRVSDAPGPGRAMD